MRQNTPLAYPILVIILIFLNSTTFFSQVTILSADKELAVQIQNMMSGSITAELKNTIIPFGMGPDVCEITQESNYTNTVTYTSIYNTDVKMGFTITKFGTYGTDYMKKTLNRLKFKDHYGKYLKYYTGQDSSEDIDLVFYYDTRDFNYYGDVNCQLQMGDEYKKDVTVRLVRNSSSQDWELWFYPGHNKSSAKPSTSGGWENVSQGTKRCWEVKGRTQCYLDWENLAPTTPQNFQLSGSVGQHPTLTWQMNREPDLNGYKIYRSENGQAYNHLYTVGINATSYTDNEVTIGNNKNDPTVCYKITAYDTDNLESSFTNSKCLKASAINKEIVGSLTETDYSYNLSYPYPNPFNPITNINFTIKKEGNVKIILYDLLGNTINILVDDYLSKGSYSLKLDASYLPSGLYFYAMNINNYFDVKKLQVIK